MKRRYLVLVALLVLAALIPAPARAQDPQPFAGVTSMAWDTARNCNSPSPESISIAS